MKHNNVKAKTATLAADDNRLKKVNCFRNAKDGEDCRRAIQEREAEGLMSHVPRRRILCLQCEAQG